MSEYCRLALKEWAVAIAAYAAGQTICAVRKGGIHEKRFDVPGRECFLFPTFLHQAPETLQPRFHETLARVYGQQPTDGHVHVTHFVQISDVVPLDAPESLDGLTPHVVWTPAYVEQRLRWRPRQPLQLLLLRVFELPREHRLPMLSSYNGCSSWVTLDAALPTLDAVPVLDDFRYAAERQAVLEAVSAVRVA
jgi:hypothetical protein